jgi:hypothetical protein
VCDSAAPEQRVFRTAVMPVASAPPSPDRCQNPLEAACVSAAAMAAHNLSCSSPRLARTAAHRSSLNA